MPAKSFIFNGINGATGDYLLKLTEQKLVAIALGDEFKDDELDVLAHRAERAKSFDMAPIHGVDVNDLAQTGWGVVFPHQGDPKVEAALQDLLDHRQSLAGKDNPNRFKIYRQGDGYRVGERALDFVTRHGSGPDLVDPDVIPFYLLLVGSPAEIPYSFQYQLDVQHSVGRIWFERLEEYTQYARNVIAAETGPERPRTAAFFAVKNPDDAATTMSATMLVDPVVEQIKAKEPDWKDGVSVLSGDDATKDNLQRLLGGDQTPTLLFTASHGMGFPKGDPRQLAAQGALLCQDWPGPRAWKAPREIPAEHYFAAADVAPDANLSGSIVFNFACYGAGTPALNDFAHLKRMDPLELADAPFVAALPRQLLQRGALATIGHVERAWSYSFNWDDNPQLGSFVSTVQCLLDGEPVGSALDPFNLKYATLSTAWSEEVKEIRDFGKAVNSLFVSKIWTAGNDARGYVIIGDPAVRLTTSPNPTTERPAIVTVEAGAKKKPASNKPAAKETAKPARPAPVSEVKPTQGTPPPVVEAGVAAFGLFGGDDSEFSKAKKRLAEVISGFADRLGEALTAAIADASELTIRTYVAENLDTVQPNGDGFSGPAKLVAITQVKVDGDTSVCVPADAGALREAVWTVHVDMVERSQANRAEMLKVAAGAAAGFFDVIRGG